MWKMTKLRSRWCSLDQTVCHLYAVLNSGPLTYIQTKRFHRPSYKHYMYVLSEPDADIPGGRAVGRMDITPIHIVD